MRRLEEQTSSWRGVYRDLPREHGWEALRVEGEIPAALRGTLYRNGPSLFSCGDEPYLHGFDGDGAVSAVRIADGKASGAVRVVDTRWRRREVSARRRLFATYAQVGRGVYRWLDRPKNPANISVLPWRDQLFALWEAGLPIALDREDLSCLGESKLGGAVQPTFSAHPHALGDTLLNFGIKYGARFALRLYELGSEARCVGEVPLRFPTLIHDFIATERYWIFLCIPRRLKLLQLAIGMRSFIENLAWAPELGTEVLLIDRADPSRTVRFEVPAFFLWHFVGAWEEDGALFVDFIRYDDDATDTWFGRAPWHHEPVSPSQYVRARIDVAEKRFVPEVLTDVPCEFPGVEPSAAGKRIERCWLLAWTGPGGRLGAPRLARFDARTGELSTAPMSAAEFPSEPVVVEAEGGARYVTSLVYDGDSDRSYLGLWDAERWPSEPLARLWFNHSLPLSFHGAWAQAAPAPWGAHASMPP